MMDHTDEPRIVRYFLQQFSRCRSERVEAGPFSPYLECFLLQEQDGAISMAQTKMGKTAQSRKGQFERTFQARNDSSWIWVDVTIS